MKIVAEAPTRIDVGGTLDLPAYSLLEPQMRPCTVNIALSLKTAVSISADRGNGLQVVDQWRIAPNISEDSVTSEEFIAACCTAFDVKDARIEVKRDYPIASGLGGSGSLAVALIGALVFLQGGASSLRRHRHRLAALGSALENAVTLSINGIQDEAAALYGGANCWEWDWRHLERPYRRFSLPLTRGIERRFLLAFSGEARISSVTTARWLEDFVHGKTRRAWQEISRSTRVFSESFHVGDWARAARALRDEMSMRQEILPECVTPAVQTLFDVAERHKCVPRISGGGAGGFVWALGEPSDISALSSAWRASLPEEGFVVTPTFSRTGLKVRA